MFHLISCGEISIEDSGNIEDQGFFLYYSEEAVMDYFLTEIAGYYVFINWHVSKLCYGSYCSGSFLYYF